MYEYLLINVSILIFPLFFSYEKRIQYYRKLPAVLISILIVGISYILWDVLANSRGDWAFNDNYIIGIRFFGIPLEEILFFITVPYSCLFIYEALFFFLPPKNIRTSRYIFLLGGITLGCLSIIYHSQAYTGTVLMVNSIFFIIAAIFFEKILHSLRYWLYIFISFIPFLIFNYLLTSIPIVTYEPSAIWGIRITTIPLEDFLYNFSLLSFYFLIFLYAKNKIWRRNREKNSSKKNTKYLLAILSLI